MRKGFGLLAAFVLFLGLLPGTAQAATSLGAVVNAAGYGRSADLNIGEARDGVALESSAVAFGTALAPFTASASPASCVQVLAGRSVVLTDHRGNRLVACLTYVSFGQINFYLPRAPFTFLPHDSLLGSVQITDGAGVAQASKSLPIRGITPGFFSADSSGFGKPSGFVLRVRADGSQAQEPITGWIDLGPPGERVFLVLYGTGIRLRTPGRTVCLVYGGVVSGGKYRPGTYICGGQVPYAGPAPGLVGGVDQVNAEIPRDVPDARGAEVFVRLFVDDPGQAPAFARWTNVLSVSVSCSTC